MQLDGEPRLRQKFLDGRSCILRCTLYSAVPGPQPAEKSGGAAGTFVRRAQVAMGLVDYIEQQFGNTLSSTSSPEI